MLSKIKSLLSVLFKKRKTNTDDEKAMIITCPRTDEEVLINVTYHNDGKIIANFSFVPKEIPINDKYIFSNDALKRLESLRQDATSCILKIGETENTESDAYAGFIFDDHLRLDFLCISVLHSDTIETQPIDVDFTIYPAVWIGFFDMLLEEMVTTYRGQYHIIMNEDKTMARICFQEEDAENIETFAVADKMLILLSKRVHHIVEIIIGGITEHIDKD